MIAVSAFASGALLAALRGVTPVLNCASDRTADDRRVSLTSGLGVIYKQWSRTGSNRRPLACHNPAHRIQDALTTLYRGFAYCKRCKHSAALREFASGCAVYTAQRRLSKRLTGRRQRPIPQRYPPGPENWFNSRQRDPVYLPRLPFRVPTSQP